MKADSPGQPQAPDQEHENSGRPWSGLGVSLAVHAAVVAALFFFQWPGREIEEQPIRTVQLVLGDGRAGATGRGRTTETGGRATESGGQGAAARTQDAEGGAAVPPAPEPAPRPTPTGSSYRDPQPSAAPATRGPATEVPTEAPPRPAEPGPPLAATAVPARTPPPLPTPRPFRPAPPPPPAPAAVAQPAPLAAPQPPSTAQPPIDLMAPREPMRRTEPPPTTAPGPPIDLFGGNAGASASAGAAGEGGAGRADAGDGRAAIGEGARENPGDDYLDRLRRHLARFKFYPEAAKRRKEEGDVVVSVTIRRDGTLENIRLDRSSGYAALDEAALDLMRRASPVPPLPDSYRSPSASVALPVGYSLSFVNRLF